MKDPAEYLRRAIQSDEIPITTVKEVLYDLGYSVSLNVFKDKNYNRKNIYSDGPGEVQIPGTGRVW